MRSDITFFLSLSSYRLIAASSNLLPSQVDKIANVTNIAGGGKVEGIKLKKY